MTDREHALMVLAQEAVVADLERLGQRISPRVLAGAIKDAGGLDGYTTPADYREAIAGFITERRDTRRSTSPAWMLGDLLTLGYQGLGGAADLRRLLEGRPKVDMIVDVRLQPFGRAPFNGPTATRLLVQSVGPAYRWDQRLGNLAYRSGGIQIKDIEAIEDVLDDLRAGQSVALMCSCSRLESCHRQALVEEAIRRQPGLRVVHLYPARP